MNMNIEQKLMTIIRDLFMGGDAEAVIDPGDDFIEAGICDSLGLVRLATVLEAEFSGIHIHDQEINRETIGSLSLMLELVSEKLEEL
jgi:acyl carrier protein